LGRATAARHSQKKASTILESRIRQRSARRSFNARHFRQERSHSKERTMFDAVLNDDRELMSCYARTSDSHVLAELYSRHHVSLVRFLRGLTRNHALAEDLAQQTWLKIMDVAARDLYAPGTATFRCYLMTVARNAFLDECTRKHARTRSSILSATEFENAVTGQGEQDSPDSALQLSQAGSLLERAVRALPAEQREVISLWSKGASIAAMASHARAPRDTVLSRKKYAFVRLRRELESCGAPAGAF
jgi:RNA polymerase sigma-70 factor (ECF subfamily)